MKYWIIGGLIAVTGIIATGLVIGDGGVGGEPGLISLPPERRAQFQTLLDYGLWV